MSEKEKNSDGATNRLLMIALVIAAAAGGAVYFFQSRYAEATEELQRAKVDYREILKEAPTINQLTQAECDALDGVYFGDGSDCQVIFSGPTGACCLSDGTCVSETENGCLCRDGDYRGDGVPCVLLLGLPPVSACPP